MGHKKMATATRAVTEQIMRTLDLALHGAEAILGPDMVPARSLKFVKLINPISTETLLIQNFLTKLLSSPSSAFEAVGLETWIASESFDDREIRKDVGF